MAAEITIEAVRDLEAELKAFPAGHWAHRYEALAQKCWAQEQELIRLSREREAFQEISAALAVHVEELERRLQVCQCSASTRTGE